MTAQRSNTQSAEKTVERLSAAEFLVRTIRDNPGEVVVAAIGPMTNVALSVTKLGAQPSAPTRAEIDEFLNRNT